MSDKLKVIKIIKQIEQRFKNDESKYLVFRGLPNKEWQIESSAARRLNNNKQSYKADFIKYHQVLLDDVKKGNYKGLKDEELRDLCDLEILAQIQHLGGATCLTDFSSNLLIALWFATEPHKENNEETDAKLYAINLKSLECLYMFQDVMNIENNYKNSIEDLLTYKCSSELKKEHFWYWKPRIMNGRINNQNSIFIFGLPAFPEALCEVVDISRHDKSQISQELREYFGIDVNTVYPDLMGFSINANNHTAIFNDFFSMNCMDIAFSYLHEKNYKNCERYISDMKKCPAQQYNQKSDPNTKKVKKCRRRNTTKCNINIADIEYLDGKCLYSQTEFEYMKSIKKEKVINSHRLVDTYIEVIRKLSGAISNKTQFAFDCMCTLFYCYYNIELCDYHYLEKNNLNIFNLLLDTKENYLNYVSEENNKSKDKSDNLIIEFRILELSIFLHNNKIYEEQVNKIKSVYKDKNMYVNSCLLLEFFRYIGQYVFEDTNYSVTQYVFDDINHSVAQEEITDKIKALKEMIDEKSKNNKNIFSFSVYWNFEDMRKWLQNHFAQGNKSKTCSNLQIFCNEVEILQEDLKLTMFEKEMPTKKVRTKKKGVSQGNKKKGDG